MKSRNLHDNKSLEVDRATPGTVRERVWSLPLIKPNRQYNKMTTTKTATSIDTDVQSDAPNDTATANPCKSPGKRLSVPHGVEEDDATDESDDIKDSRSSCSTFVLNDSAKFSLRVSLAITAASLFILAFSWPDAQWVLITAGVVSFQSNPDTGSVFKKAWQRTLGTTCGGLVGLGFGAISLAIPEEGSSGQAAYIGVVNSLGSMVMVYITCELGFKSHYASILGVFTFSIALLAFYDTDPADAWRVAIFRIVNIALGGAIGSASTLLVFPVSTKTHVEKQVSAAMKQAGETAKEVLCAIGHEDGLPSYKSMIRDQTTEDPGHAAYKQGVAGVQTTKALLDLLKYDPFFTSMNKQKKQEMVETWRAKLGRVMRIHANIITIDNVVRVGLIGDDPLQYDLLERIGKHIAELLDDSKTKESRHQVALELLNHDLPAIRIEIAGRRAEDTSSAVEKDRDFSPERMMHALSQFDEGAISTISEVFSTKQTCLFYQMVEGLILRSIRLYHL